MKKVTWDKRPMPGTIQDAEDTPFRKFDSPIAVGMRVNAKYKDRTVMLKIEKKLSDVDFEAVVTGFNPADEQYEDISIGDNVSIKREFICWVLK